jgi:hypothetical protein
LPSICQPHASARSSAPRISPALPCGMSKNLRGSRPDDALFSEVEHDATRSALDLVGGLGLYPRSCAITGRRARIRSKVTSQVSPPASLGTFSPDHRSPGDHPAQAHPAQAPLHGPQARSRVAAGDERSELALGAPSMGAKLEVKR